MSEGFETRAWVAWVIAGAVLSMLMRNPLYTLILLLVARLVATVCARPDAEWNLPLGRIALFMLPLAALINGLLVPAGETELVSLPAGWPLIGGPITLEGLVYGLESGLILLALLAFFLAFNRIVSVSDLVRLTPRAFHDLGVVILVAVTYVPETARHWRHIQEAQAIRGHRLRGFRDWQPLLIPLLIGGLERALGLAEAMVARGYGATHSERQSTHILLALALALLMLLAGWLLLLWQRPAGWLVLGPGALLLMLLLWQAGRRIQSTRYRPRPWRPADTGLVIASVVALVTVWLVRSEAYSPYPRLSVPPFNPLLGLALLLLALPAALGLFLQK